MTNEQKMRKELKNFVNINSLENLSNTPDWIISDFLYDVFEAFNRAVMRRDGFYSENHSVIRVDKEDV